MQKDPVTVTLEGRDYEVDGGELIPIRYAEIHVPDDVKQGTPGAYARWVCGGLGVMRETMIAGIARNSPYSNLS